MFIDIGDFCFNTNEIAYIQNRIVNLAIDVKIKGLEDEITIRFNSIEEAKNCWNKIQVLLLPQTVTRHVEDIPLKDGMPYYYGQTMLYNSWPITDFDNGITTKV